MQIYAVLYTIGKTTAVAVTLGLLVWVLEKYGYLPGSSTASSSGSMPAADTGEGTFRKIFSSTRIPLTILKLGVVSHSNRSVEF
jgi:hypothetical protein